MKNSDCPYSSINWQESQLFNGNEKQSLRVKRSKLSQLAEIGVSACLPRPAASQRLLLIDAKKASFLPLLRTGGNQVKDILNPYPYEIKRQKETTMKKQLKWLTIGLVTALVIGFSQMALAFDMKIKYTIPTMKTQEDVKKIKAFIDTLPGIIEVDFYLENTTVIIFFDDEELEDEKFEFRIPLKKEHGYPVTKTDILYQDPEKRN